MSDTQLAFSADDRDRVTELVATWSTTDSLHHLAVDRGAGQPTLSTLIGERQGPVLLAVSDRFLKNPNCLSGAADWLKERSEVTVVALDPSLLETLRTPAGRMQYVNHWQERYIELRKDAASYSEQDKPAFERYLAKIREVSIGVEQTLLQLLQREPVTGTSFTQSEGQTSHGLVQRAWELSESGDRAGAQVQWRIAAEQFPDGVERTYQYALYLALEEQDLSGARSELDRLLARDGHHSDGLYLSGEVHRSLGNDTAAREDWERLYDQEPNYPELDLSLGTLLSERFPGTEAMAVSLLKRATKHPSAAPDTFYRYGSLLDSAFGKRGKATKQLQRAVTINPEFAAAHYRLAVWLYEEGGRREARNHYILATARDTRYATPANQRAFLGEGADEPETPAPTHTMEDPLSSLKENIARLEEMLSDRNAPAPASPPPAPGAGMTALVSGATSGIGRATAERLSRSGFRLILLGRREDRLEKVREELETAGTEVHLLQLDVRDRKRVLATIEDLPAGWREVDILINNAGKAKGYDPIQSGDIDHWEEMIDVNLKGLLYLTRAVTPGMVKRKRGMVINVASTAGKEVYPNGNVYCATKHGVDALTYAMRLDLVKHGIRVGQICPAHVEETEFALVRFDGDHKRARIYDDFQPLRSSDVAEAIHFMVTQPSHVNVMDLVLQGTQQASSTVIHRSGREEMGAEG